MTFCIADNAGKLFVTQLTAQSVTHCGHTLCSNWNRSHSVFLFIFSKYFYAISRDGLIKCKKKKLSNIQCVITYNDCLV